MTLTTSPDVYYVDEFEFSRETMWGQMITQLQAGFTGTHYRDDELDSDIYLSSRMYTDDQLGKLDGPGAFVVKDDPAWFIAGRPAPTPKQSLTKRQRRALRKQRRAAQRAGLSFDEAETIRSMLNRT